MEPPTLWTVLLAAISALTTIAITYLQLKLQAKVQVMNDKIDGPLAALVATTSLLARQHGFEQGKAAAEQPPPAGKASPPLP